MRKKICQRLRAYSGQLRFDARNNADAVSDAAAVTGVSVYWLQTGFLQDVYKAGLTKEATVYQIENLHDEEHHGVLRNKGSQVRCPLDGKLGSAYVHALGEDPDAVGQATVMLSYTWGYKVGDIVETLSDFCQSRDLDAKRTYVWICCLCVNQHRVADNYKMGRMVPFEAFRSTFHHRVVGIGHLLAMLSPWNDPAYLKRAWCIFEVFTASINNCTVTFAMAPSDKQHLLDKARDKDMGRVIEKMVHIISNTKFKDAEASHSDDRWNIMRIVDECHGQAAVDTMLQQWSKHIILGQARAMNNDRENGSTTALSDEQYTFFLTHLGGLFANLGDMESASICNEMVALVPDSTSNNNHFEVQAQDM